MTYDVVIYSLIDYRIKRRYASEVETEQEARATCIIAEEHGRFNIQEEGIGIMPHEKWPIGEIFSGEERTRH